MEWRDEGLIIGTRKHGENAVIIEAMTTHHGRHMGLVRGGRSRRYAALLQPGNTVELNWRARLEDHLGAYTVEAKKPPRCGTYAKPRSAVAQPAHLRTSSHFARA